jgi:hypothetical protein
MYYWGLVCVLLGFSCVYYCGLVYLLSLSKRSVFITADRFYCCATAGWCICFLSPLPASGGLSRCARASFSFVAFPLDYSELLFFAHWIKHCMSMHIESKKKFMLCTSITSETNPTIMLPKTIMDKYCHEGDFKICTNAAPFFFTQLQARLQL